MQLTSGARARELSYFLQEQFGGGQFAAPSALYATGLRGSRKLLDLVRSRRLTGGAGRWGRQ